MIVTVRLFARARDLAGVDEVTLELAAGSTAADVRELLAAAVPALAGLLARSALAVNAEFADETLPIPENAEVALLPPVSGGQP